MEILKEIKGLHIVYFVRTIAVIGILLSIWGSFNSTKLFVRNGLTFFRYNLLLLFYFGFTCVGLIAFANAIMLLIWFNWSLVILFSTLYFFFCVILLLRLIKK